MTTWNNTAPAVGNQIANDIPDITENFAHIKSGLTRLMQEAWSDSDLTGIHLDGAVGMYDGTYTYTVPTNSVTANAILMTGDANTIAWFYLNTAPTGWKVTATGADTVLAVSGGASDYSGDGGTAGGDWTTTHTHTGPSHNHQWYNALAAANAHDQSYNSGGTSTNLSNGGTDKDASNFSLVIDQGGIGTTDWYTSSAGTGASGATNPFAAYRPSASIGKLYQLDTA
jgi:hypothetical protein